MVESTKTFLDYGLLHVQQFVVNSRSFDQEIITHMQVYLHYFISFHHITYLCAPSDIHVNLCFIPITTIQNLWNSKCMLMLMTSFYGVHRIVYRLVLMGGFTLESMKMTE